MGMRDEEKFLEAAAAALLDTVHGRKALKNLSPEHQRELTGAADRVWNPKAYGRK